MINPLGRRSFVGGAAIALLLLAGGTRALAAGTIQTGETLRIGSGITPGIATDDRGTVHVLTMHDGAIFHRQRPPGGEFGAAEALPLPEGKGNYNSPHAVCDARGTLHVVFGRDTTGTARKAWYTNRSGGVWRQPLLAIERTEPDRRVNYPRITLDRGVAWVSAFTAFSSTIVKVVELETAPRVAARVDTSLWVAHVFPRGDELLVVGRARAAGHKLERYDAGLTRRGEALLLSRGTPTKTLEATAATMDSAGAIHVVGLAGAPAQRLWYTTDARAVAGQDVILGPAVGEKVSESTYPVIQHDRRGQLYVSYRDHASGEARLTAVEAKSGQFLPPVMIGPATPRRLRWNPHLAAAPEQGVLVVWENNGEIFLRSAEL